MIDRDALNMQVQTISSELERYQVTSQMQADELQRLSASQVSEDTAAVSKANVVKLTEKVEALRLAYLEKEREVTVLQNEVRMHEESF